MANKKLEKKSLTVTELSFYLGTRKRLIERLVSLDVLQPLSREPDYIFSIEVIPRVQKMLELHEQLGVSWSSMGFVLDLLNRIEELEKKLDI